MQQAERVLVRPLLADLTGGADLAVTADPWADRAHQVTATVGAADIARLRGLSRHGSRRSTAAHRPN